MFVTRDVVQHLESALLRPGEVVTALFFLPFFCLSCLFLLLNQSLQCVFEADPAGRSQLKNNLPGGAGGSTGSHQFPVYKK